jgi:hypothetical protein
VCEKTSLKNDFGDMDVNALIDLFNAYEKTSLKNGFDGMDVNALIDLFKTDYDAMIALKF